jgi:putative ABC transport system permease protein
MSPLVKYVLRNLGTRPFISGLVLATMMVVGATIGGVGAVAAGLKKSFQFAGHENWVLVSERNVRSEKDSNLEPATLNPITAAIEIKRYSPEVVNTSMLYSHDTVSLVQLRALEPAGFDMHEFQLLEGRAPAKGALEFVIGEALLKHVPWLGIGATIPLINAKWTCVGVFRAPGFFSGELWTTRAAILADPQRSSLSVVYLETATAADAAAIAAKLAGEKAIKVDAVPEPKFYAKLVKDFDHLVTGMLLVFALVVTGAILTAASLVAVFQQRRLGELSVMRAMGFRSGAIAMLIFYETELLVLMGGVGGLVLTWLVLRNYVVHVDGGNLSSVNFTAPMGWTLAVVSMGVMFLVGIFGAIVPVLRMLGTPVTRGLREE